MAEKITVDRDIVNKNLDNQREIWNWILDRLHHFSTDEIEELMGIAKKCGLERIKYDPKKHEKRGALPGDLIWKVPENY